MGLRKKFWWGCGQRAVSSTQRHLVHLLEVLGVHERLDVVFAHQLGCVQWWRGWRVVLLRRLRRLLRVALAVLLRAGCEWGDYPAVSSTLRIDCVEISHHLLENVIVVQHSLRHAHKL